MATTTDHASHDIDDPGIPYDDLDPPVVDLVRVLNEAPGITTLGSCGGHPPGEGLYPEDQWFVSFRLELGDDDRPTLEAWLSFEFITWVVSHDLNRKSGRQATIEPDSNPPYWNSPGRMLKFILEGDRSGPQGVDPVELAEWIDKLASQLYIPADQLPGFYTKLAEIIEAEEDDPTTGADE